MKKIIIFTLLITVFYGNYLSQSYVLDGHAISFRYIYSEHFIDLGYNTQDELGRKLYANDSIKLTDKQIKILKNGKYKWNVPYFQKPFCYLFNEDDNWTIRTFRTIDLDDPLNYIFTKGPSRIGNRRMDDGSLKKDTTYKPKESLKEILLNDLKKGHITNYTSFKYEKKCDSIQNNKLIKNWNKINRIILKEDFYYDKKSGEFKSFILNLILVNFKNGKETQLAYFYYPEVRLQLRSFPFRNQNKRFDFWSEFMENHEYVTYSIYTKKHRDYNHFDTITPKYIQHRNDFDALWNIQLVNEYINNENIIFTGKFKDTMFNHNIISGNLENGMLQDKLFIYYPKGKLKTRITYNKNLLHGKYEGYWQNGNLKEIGKFSFGLKEGEWKSFFENGNKLSLRNYKSGWMDGKQSVWYSDGSNHINFTYKNFKLNGKFERWNENKLLLERGFFKDNFMDSTWEVNQLVPDLYKEILLNNPSLNIGFDYTAVKDGILSYTIKLKYKYDPKFCLKNDCVRMVHISEIK